MKMFGLGGLLGMLVIAAGFAVYESQQNAGVVTLEAELVGKTVSGDALYVDYGKRTAFFVTLQGAEPNADLRITFRRGTRFEKISTMQADRRGRARLTMYSSVPQLEPNDLLEVWQAKGDACVASGQMGLVGFEDE